MIPTFSFIAWSGTGKTTYLEKLIAELKKRGKRVAIIKHDGHRFDIDREGKDSWRFAQSGADMVAIADGEKCAIMEYRPTPLGQILSAVHDVDLVLIEGWHEEAENAIVLHRAATRKAPKLNPEDCIAAVTDVDLGCSVPQFPLDDAAPMAEFLIGRLS